MLFGLQRIQRGFNEDLLVAAKVAGVRLRCRRNPYGRPQFV